MDKLDAPARKHIEAAHWSEPRPRPMPPKWIILHDTEGGTASSIASYFASPASRGSAHLVCDDAETFRCLADNVIPWGAIGANTQGLHIEMCGFAHWSADDWHHHEAELHRAAFQVSEWCKKYDIPATYIGVNGLRAGARGIAGHKDVTYAFHLDSHTDPGPGFPMSYFIGLVKSYLSPPPPVPHFEVAYTDKDGAAHKRAIYLADLQEFFRNVALNHTDDEVPYPVVTTYYPEGVPE